MAVYYEKSGGGFDPLGLMAQVVGFATGQPWIGMAYNAAKSGIKGDWGGVAKQGVGLLGGQMAENTPAVAPEVPDITANQRMLNGTEDAVFNENRYQGLLGKYGLTPQAVGENADMGTRFIDNNPKDYGTKYNDLLNQYDLTDMDWTGRRKRGWM